MDNSVIVSIITGLFTVLAVLISNAKATRDTQAKIDKNQAVFEAHVTEQISGLRTTVEKHNKVIERTYKLEENNAVQDAELKRLNKRIEIIEQKIS